MPRRRAFSGMTVLRALSLAALASLSAQGANIDSLQQIITPPEGAAGPGCAVAVIQGGRTIAAQAAGRADVAAGRLLDPDTLFYAASVSKQFTALLVATLVEQRKIGLDDDVRTWIPELPRYEVPVTVQMMLHHTSGIRDSLDLLRLAGVKSYGRVPRRQALQLLYRQQATNFRPGTQYQYSNGGYLLLSEIVERVSGMPFAAFGQKIVFGPLGMTRSFFLADAPPAGANVAHGYLKSGSAFELRDTYPWMSGSGGLMTSVNDLASFEQDVQLRHRVWTPAIAKVMESPGHFTDGAPVRMKDRPLVYASGLLVGERRGQYWVEHSGSAEGFSHLYARLPNRQLGVILLCNRVDVDLDARMDEVVNAFDKGALTGPPPPARKEAADPRAGAPVSGEALPLAGRYRSEDLDATYVVSVAPGQLTVRIVSPWAVAGNVIDPVRFTRTGTDSWTSTGSRLVFSSDRTAFEVQAEGARGLHFERITGAR